ncbi:MAG TPA: hypothetical protein VK587_08830, partial [bacterium]|nr:hypothetical protein [bacterium]
MDVLVSAGTEWQIGYAHGTQLAEAVAANVGQFWGDAARAGWDRRAVLASALRGERRVLGDARCEEIAGIAAGARLAYPEILA